MLLIQLYHLVLHVQNVSPLVVHQKRIVVHLVQHLLLLLLLFLRLLLPLLRYLR